MKRYILFFFSFWWAVRDRLKYYFLVRKIKAWAERSPGTIEVQDGFLEIIPRMVKLNEQTRILIKEMERIGTPSVTINLKKGMLYEMEDLVEDLLVQADNEIALLVNQLQKKE